MDEDFIRMQLRNAHKRNPDAYTLIGAVSGLGESRIRDIAENESDMSRMEFSMLVAYARA